MFIYLSSRKQLNIRRVNKSVHRFIYKNTRKEISFYGNYYKIQYNEWVKNGKLHRIDGPAINTYFESGQLCIEKWFKDGKCYRSNGAPAVICYYKNGQIKEEKWYEQIGELHRLEGGPVIVIVKYFENGIFKERWYKNGKYYLVDYQIN